MACFMKDTIPYKYFENLIPISNQNCELGIRELQLSLRRMRLDDAVKNTTDVIELAILELLFQSQTYSLTEEDLQSQLWSCLSSSVLYCTPNLKTRFKQTLRETINVLSRAECRVIYIRKGNAHNLDMLYLRSEILDYIALYVERFRYGNVNLENNCEREQFRLSLACMKILIYAEQNIAKSAASSLQRSINWIQNRVSSVADNLEPLLDLPLNSWSTESVLKLHLIYSAMQVRRSLMIKLNLNIPLPTFSASLYPSVESI